MKLFHKLLVAPAALGLLAPLSAGASEFNVSGISEYGIDQEEFTEDQFNSNSFSSELVQTKTELNNEQFSASTFEAGSFSDTTVASFGADFLVGAVSGEFTLADKEAVSVTYDFGIDLDTSFTGEDNLNVGIVGGNTAALNTLASTLDFGNANADALKVNDVNYTRSFGEKLTVQFGDSLDVSSQFAGACAYSGYTDTLADCGTGNSAGAGGDVSLSSSYDMGSGFTLGFGMSGNTADTAAAGLFTKESSDLYAVQVAYNADNYGAAVSYANADTTTTDTVYWGLNGYYSFNNLFIDSISVGYEHANPSVCASKPHCDAKGAFVGITTQEIGPGTISLAAGTSDDINGGNGNTGLTVENMGHKYLYELSYGWSINDSMSATLGGFIQERLKTEGEDLTGVSLTTSFAF